MHQYQSINSRTPHPITGCLENKEKQLKKEQRKEFRRAWKEMSDNFFREEEIHLQKSSPSSSEEDSLAVSRAYWPFTPPATKSKGLDRPLQDLHQDHHMQRNGKTKHQEECKKKEKSKAKNMIRGLKKIKQRIVNTFSFARLHSSSSSSSTSVKSVVVAPRNSI